MQLPQPLVTITTMIGLLLPKSRASPIHTPYSIISRTPVHLQQRDTPNTTVWIPTAAPQQLCTNITIDFSSPSTHGEAYPNCTALRNKYAQANTTTTGHDVVANPIAGYWNITEDFHATIVGPIKNTTWPFSILDRDETCTFYVATAYLIDPSENYHFGSVDFVNVLDAVIPLNATVSGQVACRDPSSNTTNLGTWSIGAGRPTRR